MFTFILIVELLVTIAMIGAILLQRSEGGALGMGGGGGGGGLMSSRGAGNALTRGTAVLAGLFFVCSITLAVLAKGQVNTGLDYSGETDAPALPVSDTVLPNDTNPVLPGDEESASNTGAAPSDTAPASEEESAEDENRPQIPE